MLTKVNFSCGHEAEVNLSNNEQKRLEKIAELELNGLCPDCRKAEWEKEDQKNNKGCVCVRITHEMYQERYPHCKERLTGFPKEKEYTYIFLPIEELITETFRKYIETKNVPYEEMIATVTEKFAHDYPELYNKLRPVSLDEPEPFINKISESETPVEPAEAPAAEPQLSDAEDAFKKIINNEEPIQEAAPAETEAFNIEKEFDEITETELGLDEAGFDSFADSLNEELGLDKIAKQDIEADVEDDVDIDKLLADMENEIFDDVDTFDKKFAEQTFAKPLPVDDAFAEPVINNSNTPAEMPTPIPVEEMSTIETPTVVTPVKEISIEDISDEPMNEEDIEKLFEVDLDLDDFDDEPVASDSPAAVSTASDDTTADDVEAEFDKLFEGLI